jgi:ABC-type multidrug transport system fused ATPase/permease subunit
LKIKEQLKGFRNGIATVFTSVLMLILISYLFVEIGLDTQLDADFWTTFVVNFAIMLAITTIWYTTTKQKEAERNVQYKNQRVAYSVLMQRVSETNNFKGLKKFCEEATEKNRISKIKNKLEKHNIDYDIYQKYEKDLNGIDADEFLSDEQKTVLKHIITNGLSYKFLFWHFKGYKTITDNQITNANDGLKQEYDIKNSEKGFDVKTFSLKTVSTILSAFGVAMIVFSGKGFDWAKLAQILTWFGLILFNMFQAVNSGRKAISIHRTNYYKKLRTFLEEFCGSEYYDNSIEWVAPKIKGENNESKEI